MNEVDEEDVRYFRKRLLAALDVPLEYLRDFYLARWENLEVESVTQVFPEAIKTEDTEDVLMFSFSDVAGNTQFIIGRNGGSVVGSHGQHTLSSEQYLCLLKAGADVFL